jgi:alpha-tubulin suppressor-like RCC1 family protein
VNGLPPVARIFAGGANTCAFLIDGGVRCWGANEGGQLGDGTRSARATPTPLPGGENLVSLAIGNNARAGSAHPDLTKSAGFSCAVQRDGGVSCWGSNNTGQLGDGTREDRPTPVAVVGVSDALEIAVGNQHACALRKDGSVACWGRNEFGSVGDANMGPSTIRSSAVAAIGVADAVGLALGGTHSCARRRNGGILCWGVNNFGQLGDGSMVLHPVPHAASDFP